MFVCLFVIVHRCHLARLHVASDADLCPPHSGRGQGEPLQRLRVAGLPLALRVPELRPFHHVQLLPLPNGREDVAGHVADGGQ